jgi:hypothetical protein
LAWPIRSCATYPFFLRAGAAAFKRDLPDADVRFVPTGHFALETRVAEIAAAIRDHRETT